MYFLNHKRSKGFRYLNSLGGLIPSMPYLDKRCSERMYAKNNAAGGIRTRDLQISQMMALRYASKPYESGALTN